MTCTCTTIVGPTTAETQPTGRRTSSGRTSTSSGSTAGSGVPCSLNTTTRAGAELHPRMCTCSGFARGISGGQQVPLAAVLHTSDRLKVSGMFLGN